MAIQAATASRVWSVISNWTGRWVFCAVDRPLLPSQSVCADNSSERTLIDAPLPCNSERPLYIVDPSVITGDRPAVPDAERPVARSGSGLSRTMPNGYERTDESHESPLHRHYSEIVSIPGHPLLKI